MSRLLRNGIGSKVKKIAICTGSIGLIGGLYHYREWLRTKPPEMLRFALAGSSAAIMMELFCHPIDTLNMRSKISPAYLTETFGINNRTLIKYINNTTKSVYRGASYVCFGYPGPLLIYYMIYHTLTEWARKKSFGQWETIGLSFGIAALSESAFITLAYPFELVKTKIQVKTESKGKEVSVRNIFREGCEKSSVLKGLKGLYLGFAPYFATYVTYVTLQFGVYVLIMESVMKPKMGKNSDRISVPMIIGSAVTSAIVASVFTNPLESCTVISQTHKPINILECLKNKNMWMRGLFCRIIYNSVMSVLLFYSLEHFTRYMNVKFTH